MLPILSALSYYLRSIKVYPIIGFLSPLILDRAPEIDISELESLFSAATLDGSGSNKAGGRRSNINKPEKVQLVRYTLSLLLVFYFF